MTTVIITDEKNTTVVQNPTTTTVVTTGMMLTPPSASSLSNSTDVDLTALANGGILVYNTSTSKWTATNLLENQIFEAGQF